MVRTRGPLEQIAISRRWTDEDARVVLDALEASGLPVKTFALRHGIQAQRVFLWRRKLRDKCALGTKPVEFVEVDARPRAVSGRRYEVVLPDGTALRVENGVDVGEVRALVEILRETSSC